MRPDSLSCNYSGLNAQPFCERIHPVVNLPLFSIAAMNNQTEYYPRRGEGVRNCRELL